MTIENTNRRTRALVAEPAVKQPDGDTQRRLEELRARCARLDHRGQFDTVHHQELRRLEGAAREPQYDEEVVTNG